MKIVFLNGSPKNIELSTTMQYAKYLMKSFPENEYSVFEIGKQIKKIDPLERNDEESRKAIFQSILQCDAIIFCFPVYFLSIPSQLKRFIELIFENQTTLNLSKKYATAISTSAHYFDNLAQDYIQAISEDLGLSFYPGFSAKTYDLLNPFYQKNLKQFFINFTQAASNRSHLPKIFPTNHFSSISYKENQALKPDKSSEKSIIVLTDHIEDLPLDHMIKTFLSTTKYQATIINLHEIQIKGGCLGCLKCCAEGVCVYKDDIRSIYDEHLSKADAILYAGTITDRYLSSRWKMFFDRSFFKGHRPVLKRKHCGLMLSGSLRNNSTLYQMITGLFMATKMNFQGAITDEFFSNEEIKKAIIDYTKRFDQALETEYSPPITFPGYASHLHFRDFTYANSFVFRLDHQLYKTSGLYDYPMYNKRIRKMNRKYNLLFKIPSIAKKAQSEMNKNMVSPFKRLFKEE